ncbi:MAG: stage II sporulation protein R [Oscillospiraceae bacterium]|nr:stage II sporulation protein R [Oscillospiraceae bacterium]
MKELRGWKIWELALLIALCAGVLTGLWAQRTQENIADQMVRLHVLAVDDSEEEQSVKLQVRDKVLEYLQPILAEADSREEAQELVQAHLEDVQKAARTAAGGRRVAVTLSEEYYPTRDYEGFSLPAGQYTSLRVVLGNGAGHNWWCVVYPPLCVAAAMETTEAMEVLSENTASIITQEEGYVYKFKIIELWSEFTEKWNQ